MVGSMRNNIHASSPAYIYIYKHISLAKPSRQLCKISALKVLTTAQAVNLLSQSAIT